MDRPGTCLVLRGAVVSGRGEGEIYVNLYAREFERVLGFRPYPGTLNVMLDGEHAARRASVLDALRPLIIHPPRGIPGLVDVRCYPAELSGLRVFIVEPMIPGYDRSMVELVSPIYLREALHLRNGDTVEIIVLCR